VITSWVAHEGHFVSGLQAAQGKLYSLGTFPWKSMKIWNWNTKSHVLTLKSSKTCCQLSNLHLSADNMFVTGINGADTITSIRLETFDSQVLEDHSHDVAAMSVTTHQLFTGDAEGRINVWELNSGRLLLSFKAHATSIKSMAATESYLVSGDNAGAIKIWQLYSDALGDADNDNLSDQWETLHKLNANDKTDRFSDPDNDNLLNIDEYINQTDPRSSDTDNDLMPDKWELDNGFNPKDPTDALKDADGDGVSNLEEYQNGTNPHEGANNANSS
jgi:hypothetical protein